MPLFGKNMITKDSARKEFKEYESVRDEFFNFLDKNIPFIKGTNSYDFGRAKSLDPKEVYELFFKLDYQARKVRGIAVELVKDKFGE